MLEVERIRYYDSISSKTWKLFPRRGLVPPAEVYGKPRAFELVQDPVTPSQQDVIYEPFSTVQATDKLLLTYWRAPNRLSLDADVPVTLQWDNEIIKRAEFYVLTHLNKMDQAKALWQTKLEQMNPTPPQS
jgi:hypothetical protein